jgi:hypothetical protein
MSFGVSDAISMVTLIRQVYQNHRIISALFDWEGKRIEGSDKLKVKRVPLFVNVWWYIVEPFDDYQFVRIPMNPGAVVEAVDQRSMTMQDPADTPEVASFRYVPAHWPEKPVMASGRTYLPNAKVGFMVFAYKPSDLLTVSKDK